MSSFLSPYITAAIKTGFLDLPSAFKAIKYCLTYILMKYSRVSAYYFCLAIF
jgi:hypothetical protein